MVKVPSTKQEAVVSSSRIREATLVVADNEPCFEGTVACMQSLPNLFESAKVDRQVRPG